MSEQDFFFDEDEQPQKSEKAETAKKSAVANRPAAKTAAAAAPAAQSVTMTVAALIGVVALLAGVIVGILLPIGGGASSADLPGATAPTAGGTGGGTQNAPQLSPEQLQGGELPPGHPQIGGSTGATGSAETTGKK